MGATGHNVVVATSTEVLTMQSVRKGPRKYTAAELRRVGVEIERVYGISDLLSCSDCGKVWMPMLLPGARLPRGYWKCPNGCNVDE